MPLDVGAPLIEERKLMTVDPTGETYVRIRQARHGDELKRAGVFFRPAQLPFGHLLDAYLDRTRSLVEEGTLAADYAGELYELVDQIYDFTRGVTIGELRVFECFLTFEGCNITWKGKPMFPKSLKENWHAFRDKFNLLPDAVAENWKNEVWEINPDWGFRRAASPPPESDESESEEKSENT